MYSGSIKQLTLINFFEPPHCKRCGSHSIVKDGWYRKRQRIHRYRCKRCGLRFVIGDLPNYRFPTNVITFAVRLYSETGISLRTVARKVKELFCIAVSHMSVLRWVKKCAALPLPVPQPKKGAVWHADETFVRCHKEFFRIWVVMDRETRAALSWRVSKERDFSVAVPLLRDAVKAAGMRPREIVTDGLWVYSRAVKKVLGYRFVKHTVSSGIGRNAVLERLNKEIKRRVKWFKTFHSVENIQLFMNLWFYHYNQRYNSSTKTVPFQCSLTPPKTLQRLLKGYPTP